MCRSVSARVRVSAGSQRARASTLINTYSHPNNKLSGPERERKKYTKASRNSLGSKRIEKKSVEANARAAHTLQIE